MKGKGEFGCAKVGGACKKGGKLAPFPFPF